MENIIYRKNIITFLILIILLKNSFTFNLHREHSMGYVIVFKYNKLRNNVSITHSNFLRCKRNNKLNVMERSVDKVTGHFMKDKELFLEVDKKQKMIEEIEKMKVFDYDNVKKYLDVLSENDVYEEIINHKIHLYKKYNEKEKQNHIIKMQNFLNPYIVNLRKKKAKEKVEYLISRLITGDNVDQIIMEMFKKKLIDVYVLTFIDDKIIEAHSKLVKNDKLNSGEEMSISEKILRTLKDRIIAQEKLNKKGTFNFTRILFLSTTLDMNENREPLIKSIIKSIDELEEFELYLLDALEYAEDNEKMKKYIPHMELLLNTCKKMNPIHNQFLNKQSENIKFFPDNVDTSHLKDL
ncbi:conserved Plasmodium protein, unknown function [Plasmodium gallinaceum]|uniref:Uncharacterized protein n=1 Tax=Plasmodium gallinaceum TaxID=5849 RepID=A0A1J1GLU9_PLAGA|nr:conserved Plasmodium protein, unknown function [Plasmodium gallinaceum]CRG93390.1 conserved Plasmodium protein, unknown function [Plasmodium gallinaceum]